MACLYVKRFPSLPARYCLLGALMLLSGCASLAEPGRGTPVEAADAYTRLGLAYFEQDSLGRSMTALNRALEFAPHHAEALQALALVYQRQGENRLAREHFQEALKQAPELTQARNNYAAFLYATGSIEQACNQLEQATQDTQYPRRGSLFTNLGQCYIALEEADEARRSLKRAQQINPNLADSYRLLAELEHAKGNLMQAWQSLEAYLRLAAPNQATLKLATDLARARGDHAQARDYQQQLDNAR